MENEKTVREAVLARSKRHPDLWLKNSVSGDWGNVIEKPCPKCGARVACAYAEMGALDFDHHWAHVCLNPECDYISEEGQQEPSSGYTRHQERRPNQSLVRCVIGDAPPR